MSDLPHRRDEASPRRRDRTSRFVERAGEWVLACAAVLVVLWLSTTGGMLAIATACVLAARAPWPLVLAPVLGRAALVLDLPIALGVVLVGAGRLWRSPDAGARYD